MKAWHFVGEDKRLGYGDNRMVKVGKTYIAKGPLEMCKNGMHGSRRILDALRYAPGPIICRVELSGEIIHDTDKSVARSRKVLAMVDGTAILQKFARMCALDVIHLWDAPDIVVRYLKTGDEKIRVAAWVAARVAARAASDATRKKQNRRLTAMTSRQ